MSNPGFANRLRVLNIRTSERGVFGGPVTDTRVCCGRWQAFLVKNGLVDLFCRSVGISSPIREGVDKKMVVAHTCAVHRGRTLTRLCACSAH